MKLTVPEVRDAKRKQPPPPPDTAGDGAIDGAPDADDVPAEAATTEGGGAGNG